MIFACICGGIGEYCIGAAILSAIACVWRKRREKKLKSHDCIKPHDPSCKCHCHKDAEGGNQTDANEQK